MKKKLAGGEKREFALNLKRFEITVVVALWVLLGPATVTSALSSSSASSSPEAKAIRTEIAALLEKVEELKGKLKEMQQGGMSTSTPQQGKSKRICPLIARSLLSGAHGDDVKELQEFLADEGYFDRKHISAYFGPLTKSALEKWQAAEGVITSGSASSTGWGVVGPRTKEFILKRCGGWKENKLIPTPFGTSTFPRLDKKGPNMMDNGCPMLTLPPLGSCDGKLRLDWKSQSGGGAKCLAWNCHSDDDEENDEDSDDDEDDSDDDDSATSTDSD